MHNSCKHTTQTDKSSNEVKVKFSCQHYCRGGGSNRSRGAEPSCSPHFNNCGPPNKTRQLFYSEQYTQV